MCLKLVLPLSLEAIRVQLALASQRPRRTHGAYVWPVRESVLLVCYGWVLYLDNFSHCKSMLVQTKRL